MFYILIVLVSAATFLLQASVLPQVAVFHVSLNIVVLTALFWLIFLHQNFAVTFSLVLGFLLDIFSASVFGSFAVSLVLVVLIVKRIIDLYFQKENIFSSIFLQVIGIILFDVFYAVINLGAGALGISHATVTLKVFLVNIVPISALWAAAASLILFRFYKRLSSGVEYFQTRSRG
jgi:rod shape-determining protein MreD